MDIENLIEQLKYYGTTYAIGDNLGKEIDGSDELMLNAATALSTLQIENQALRNAANGFKAENEKMRVELEQKSKLIVQQAEEMERRDALLKEQEAELEQVKAERDAAVEKIREWEKFDTYLFVHNFMTPEKWRGQKED